MSVCVRVCMGGFVCSLLVLFFSNISKRLTNFDHLQKIGKMVRYQPSRP